MTPNRHEVGDFPLIPHDPPTVDHDPFAEWRE